MRLLRLLDVRRVRLVSLGLGQGWAGHSRSSLPPSGPCLYFTNIQNRAAKIVSALPWMARARGALHHRPHPPRGPA